MAAQYHHSLRFDADKCDGCMSCMRVCPTAAVRIRKGHAVKLEDRCIDCGECIRVCPEGAIVPLTDQMADLSKFEYKIAIPSPALYAQFDSEVFPGMIFAALKQCGFDDVESRCRRPAMIVTAATEIFLNEYRGQYPLISSFCPTVVRLVQVNYPELVDQLLPVLAPREISAGNAKGRKASGIGNAAGSDRSGLYHSVSRQDRRDPGASGNEAILPGCRRLHQRSVPDAGSGSFESAGDAKPISTAANRPPGSAGLFWEDLPDRCLRKTR